AEPPPSISPGEPGPPLTMPMNTAAERCGAERPSTLIVRFRGIRGFGRQGVQASADWRGDADRVAVGSLHFDLEGAMRDRILTSQMVDIHSGARALCWKCGDVLPGVRIVADHPAEQLIVFERLGAAGAVQNENADRNGREIRHDRLRGAK